MGSKESLLFDLNEPPIENEDDNDGVVCFQPQRAIPSTNIPTTDLFVAAAGSQGIVNNHAFFHASSVSGFQPFLRSKVVDGPSISAENRSSRDMLSSSSSLSKAGNSRDMKDALDLQSGAVDAQAIEKEDGEWDDAEGSDDANARIGVVHEDSSGASDKQLLEKGTVEVVESNVPVGGLERSPDYGDGKNENGNTQLELIPEISDKKGDLTTDRQKDSAPLPKQRDIRKIEANHALKCPDNLGKRPKFDQQKEAMLGKKRSRQTMFLNLEDVKQVGVLKSSTPKRQIPAPSITRTVKEARPALPSMELGDKQTQPVVRDTKQGDLSSNEGNTFVESNEHKSESIGDNSSWSFGPVRRFNSSTDVSLEGQAPPVPRHSSWKMPTDTRLLKNSQFSGRRPTVDTQISADPKLAAKKLPSKKQSIINNQYQDTSVERLLREVTNEKFWHHPEEEELQRVPGRFGSVEEYIRVFEPLLFEECRAQLYSTWEESSETISRHVRVGIKSIERRERGITMLHQFSLVLDLILPLF